MLLAIGVGIIKKTLGENVFKPFTNVYEVITLKKKQDVTTT